MLVLVEGPFHPEHVTADRDGIVYATDVERVEADLPARYRGIVRPDDRAGPPWATQLFGLEVDRFDIRDRFLTQLRADATDGRPLARYGDILAAAFHHIWGGRGATADTPGFVAFVRAALADEQDPRIRTVLEHGLRDRDPAWADPRIERTGALAIAFCAETGHVPADHPSLLYWMSALVPGWINPHFGQIASESDDADPDRPHTLQAWWAGDRFAAPAENRGDFVDPWSCAALINVILRDVARIDIRIYVDPIDDAARVIAAPRSALRALIADGVIGAGGE